MIVSLLLSFLCFISLGLPDGLLGAAWPVIHLQFEVPITLAGNITMISAFCTIITSVQNNRLTSRLGTLKTLVLAIGMTALSLFGFSQAKSFTAMMLCAVPYGLGAGTVDTTLNNFVARHYKSRHMNWLHCFWSIGAAIGPVIMGHAIAHSAWPAGYRRVAYIQLALIALLLVTQNRWKTFSNGRSSEKKEKVLSFRETLKIRQVKTLMLSLFCYCCMETTCGVWASSYLADVKHIPVDRAAAMCSLFYLGITLGRFASGFISNRMGDRKMIHLGESITALSLAGLLFSPFAPLSLVGIGVGCAPIFPAIIHATPSLYTEEEAAAIVGVEMASAYTGSTFAPPVFGLIARFTSLSFYPVFLTLSFTLFVLMTKRALKQTKHT